jgi:hypothetical protein
MLGWRPLEQTQPYVKVSFASSVSWLSDRDDHGSRAYRIAAVADDGAGRALLANDGAVAEFVIAPRPFKRLSAPPFPNDLRGLWIEHTPRQDVNALGVDYVVSGNNGGNGQRQERGSEGDHVVDDLGVWGSRLGLRRWGALCYM